MSPSKQLICMAGFGLFHEENRRYDAALSSFQAAASAGHIPSHFCVFKYLSETRPGVALDPRIAFAAAQAGASGGHLDCVAAVAFCHLKGVGTDVNVAAAHELCSRSVDVFSPMFSYVQGLLHLETEAPAALKKRSALPFLQIAAAAEICASASFSLAVLLSEIGDELCDIPQAIRHLRFASSLGMQPAKDLLARLVPQEEQPIELSQLQPTLQPTGQLLQTKFDGHSTSFHDKQDSKFCSTFGQIYVRPTTSSGTVHEKQPEVSHPIDFEASPNAKACLAPNIVIISSTEGAAVNPARSVPLHFPVYDDKGLYSNPAPVVLPSESEHTLVYYSGARSCQNCSRYRLLFS